MSTKEKPEDKFVHEDATKLNSLLQAHQAIMTAMMCQLGDRESIIDFLEAHMEDIRKNIDNIRENKTVAPGPVPRDEEQLDYPLEDIYTVTSTKNLN